MPGEQDPVLRQSTITLAKIKIYEANAGGTCPHCESDMLEYDDQHFDHGVIEQEVECMDCGNKWKDQYRFTKMVFSDDQAAKLAPELREELRKDSRDWTVIGFYANGDHPYTETFDAETAQLAARKAFLNNDESLCIVDVIEGDHASRLDNTSVVERVQDLVIDPDLLAAAVLAEGPRDE